MVNIRFGVRYTTDPEKDIDYLQLQKIEDVDFARPGELFINEPLNKIYFCQSSTGLFKELNPTALDQLTPEDIKTLYELNPDTNAFTDYLKDKIEQVVDKSEANERDIANRDRSNHTGTQSIYTIIGLKDALDNKEPLDTTILKEADIGVSLQPFNANTVIDENYVATEENYTSLEKAKLASIESGAGISVNADWNAVEGDALILNKPLLGTAAATDSIDYATAAQGFKADSAVQPLDIAEFETSTQLNARDIANRDRSNHTGTQNIDTISGLREDLDSRLNKTPFGGFIERIKDKTYPLFKPDSSYVIKSLRVKSNRGTCTWDIKINGVSIPELSSVNISSIEQYISVTANNIVLPNERVEIVCSNNVEALDIEFTIMLELP